MLEIRHEVIKGSESVDSGERYSSINREEFATVEKGLVDTVDELLRHLAADPSVAGVAFSAVNDHEKHVFLIRQNSREVGNQPSITIESVDQALVGISASFGLSFTASEVVANGSPFDDVVARLMEQCQQQKLTLIQIVRFD